MNARSSVVVAADHPSRSVFIAGAAWFLSYVAARYAIDAWEPKPHWDIAIASFPVFAFYWFVWIVQRNLKAADEMRRRIHLEALGLSFLVTMLVLMLLGLLDGPSGGRLGLSLRDIWAVLPPLYGLCFLAANHRYR
jgi:hypothetical protein